MAKTEKKRGHNVFIHTCMGNNCAIVSWLGFIQIWSRAYDQESTNYSDHFVEWKSSYITMDSDLVLFANLFELTWMICVGGSCPRNFASDAYFFAMGSNLHAGQAITDMDQKDL